MPPSRSSSRSSSPSHKLPISQTQSQCSQVKSFSDEESSSSSQSEKKT
ncbi:10609_t:CDS:1, partial [Diversispora eburnea]